MRLGTVARPDAWRITSGLAAALHSTRLRDLASGYVDALAARSGDYADDIRAAADKVLG